MFENVETVLAIEVLTAAQALDYRLPLRPGRGVEAAHRLVRARTTHREADYLFQDDLARVFELVRGHELLEGGVRMTYFGSNSFRAFIQSANRSGQVATDFSPPVHFGSRPRPTPCLPFS